MKTLLRQPPSSLCILLQSTAAEACQALPMIRTLQEAWPQTVFTWIGGAAEAKLLAGARDIEMLSVGGNGITALRRLRRLLDKRKFDVLLHLQPTLRANALTMSIRARVKLGFDRAQQRRLQWLFTTHRIEPAARQHAVDCYFGFAERLGVRDRSLRWDVPLPNSSRDFAQRLIPDGGLTLAIAPFAASRHRRWRPEYYAQVAEFAASAYSMRLVLCGGHAAGEQQAIAAVVKHLRKPANNATGRESIHDLMAVYQRATVVLAPDSDAAHLATAVGTPVIGLYAATNSARIGPYLSRQLCVDKYDAATRALLGKTGAEAPWSAVVDREGVMDLITPDDVIKKLQTFMAQRMRRKS